MLGPFHARVVAQDNRMIALDTEFYQHTGFLHRPGGKFACLTISGDQTEDSIIVDAQQTTSYLSALKRGSNGADVIVMQNALYDLRQMRHHGLIDSKWRPKLWDTMLVERDLFGGLYPLFGLNHLSRRWLRHYLSKGTGADFVDASSMTPTMKKYAIADAVTTYDVAVAQEEYVNDQFSGDFGWYWDIDLPALWAVLDMQPVRLDVDAWIAHADTLERKGIRIQDGLGFNVKSREQVRDALRSTGLRIKDKQSCDAGNLERWLERARLGSNERRADLIEKIMESRACRDAPSKYGRKFVEDHVEEGGYIYPSWKVTGAKTGRMACGDPTLQNIPIRDKGWIYRTFFLASRRHRLLVTDVESQEMMFSAGMSNDEVMMEEFLNNVDTHKQTAKLFGLRSRSAGKNINYGLNYGMGAKGLAARVGISLDDAEAGLRARRLHYPAYHAWQERQIRLSRRLGYVNTAAGRPGWVNPHSWGADRNAINNPIQGSAADHVKLALGYIHQQCEADNIPFSVVMVIHDEIVLDVPPGLMKKTRKIVENAWKEAGHKLLPSLPTRVGMASGPNWGVKE